MTDDYPNHPPSNGHADPFSQTPSQTEPWRRHPSMTLRTSLSRVRSNQVSDLTRIRSSQQTTSSQSEDPEIQRPAQPPSPAPPEANAPPPAEEVTVLRLAAHYSTLVLASMLGTLTRLGLEALTTCKRAFV